MEIAKLILAIGALTGITILFIGIFWAKTIQMQAHIEMARVATKMLTEVLWKDQSDERES